MKSEKKFSKTKELLQNAQIGFINDFGEVITQIKKIKRLDDVA